MADMIYEEAQSISDRTLKALAKKKAPEGKRVEIRDANHPGFIIHVNDRGKITFLVNGRFPGQKSSSRRTIGIYGTETDSDAGIFTLAAARTEAERWRNEVKKGNDPKAERERKAEEIRRAEQAQQRQQAGTVGKAIEEFVRIKLAHERKGEEVARDIRKEFGSRWGGRPLASNGTHVAFTIPR